MESELDRIAGATDRDDDPIRPGAIVGNYEVQHALGSGGFGAVFAARHTGLDKPVVVKSLHAQLATDAVAVRRFLREGRAASRIRHPHVVDVTDVGVHEGVPYLVMERLEGEDLAARLLARGKLGVAESLAILIPVMDALSRAHEAGIVHRDVKPSNVFLSREPHGEVPKLLDFGIAKVAWPEPHGPSMTRSGGFMGTPYYASPEQARNARDVGPASDQYSLATILFELVSGSPPFEGDNPYAVLAAVHEGNHRSFIALCPDQPALAAVLERAMQVEPSDRYPSLRAMGRALLPLASAETAARWRDVFAVDPTEDVAPPTPAAARASDPSLAETLAAGASKPSVEAGARTTSSRAPLLTVGAVALLALAGAVWFLADGGLSADAAEVTDPSSTGADAVLAAPGRADRSERDTVGASTAESESESVSESVSESAAVSESESESAAESESESESAAESETASDAESETASDAESETAAPRRRASRRRGRRRDTAAGRENAPVQGSTQIGVGTNNAPVLR